MRSRLVAELDEDAEPVMRWRGFVGPEHRGGNGYLADSVFFGRWRYTWNGESFILYNVLVGISIIQYILKEPVGTETTSSHSSVVDRLMSTIGAWLLKEEPAIYVYDRYWARSTKLWKEVEKARWEDVILNPKMKKALTEVATKFFDNEAVYKEYGVPWKRGLIFHGPVGKPCTRSWTCVTVADGNGRKRQDSLPESVDAHVARTQASSRHTIRQVSPIFL